MTYEGNAPATSLAKSHSPRSMTLSTTSRAMSEMRSLSLATCRGVNPLLTRARSAVCRGGSIVNIISPADIGGVVGTGHVEVHPRRLRRPRGAVAGHGKDLVVAGKREEPRSVLVRVPCHRRALAELAECVVGHALRIRACIGKVDTADADRVFSHAHLRAASFGPGWVAIGQTIAPKPKAEDPLAFNRRHSSITVTTGTYVGVIEAVQRDALDSMASLFDGHTDASTR